MSAEFAAWRARLARQTPPIVKRVIISNDGTEELEQKQRAIEALTAEIESLEKKNKELKQRNDDLTREIATWRSRPKGDPFSSPLKIISRTVAHELGFGLDDLMVPLRTQHIVNARQIVMYFGSTIKGSSAVARFWGRDHATVSHAVQKIERLRAQKPEFDSRMRAIKQKLEDSGEAAHG